MQFSRTAGIWKGIGSLVSLLLQLFLKLHFFTFAHDIISCLSDLPPCAICLSFKPVYRLASLISLLLQLFLSLQAVVVFAPYAITFYLLVLLPRGLFLDYFKPDYQTAVMGHYRRPIIGLHLCPQCRVMKNGPVGVRVSHHDNLLALKKSANHGCWLCNEIHTRLLHLERLRGRQPQPLDDEEIAHLRTLSVSTSLLTWFAQWTETKNGYLDGFRHETSAINYLYGLHPREIGPNFASDYCFAIVDDWLWRCNSSALERHRCYQGRDMQLPARVIDVSSADPYLLISDGRRAPYMTLSHCWGEEQPVTTTLSNLSSRISGLPAEVLPALYRDAIAITRRLGIKYLWIDSLCIIQDSKEDWVQESAKMGDIYRHSYLTIFALDSENCHEGILTQRQAPEPPLAASEPKASPVQESLRPPSLRGRQDILRKAPLYERAWALQERLLSPRILYYSRSEMFWECLAHTARENSWRFEPYKVAIRDDQTRDIHNMCLDIKVQFILPLGEDPSYPISPSIDWHVIATEYSRCKLTYHSDRLPALSGLAIAFQRNTLYKYLAGLWEEDFVNGLLWFAPVEQEESGPMEVPLGSTDLSTYLSPSWSWVSCKYPIQYKTITTWREFPHPSTLDIRLVNSHVTLVGSNPMGEVQSAVVDVDGMLETAWYEHGPKSRRCWFYDSAGRKFGSGILDSEENDSAAGRRQECGVIRVTTRKFQYIAGDVVGLQSYWIYFLIIAPAMSSGGVDCWRRLGLGWSSAERDVFVSSRSTLTLI